jgi:carbonic anhydrase
MLSTLVLAASLMASVSANCAYGTSAFPRKAQVTVDTFGYDALKGPLNWYGLNETANYACATGSRQSPIVIDSTISVFNASTVTNFTVQDYPSGATFENLGATVEVVVNGTLVDAISNTTFKLAQFHFHTPSEHRVDSEFYPMEMHWVLESDGQEKTPP